MLLRREVKNFAEEMEYKLAIHDDRPGWKHCPLDWLIMRLKEELAEVERVVQNKGDGWLNRLKDECADVANFAMMIQDAAIEQWAENIDDRAIPKEFRGEGKAMKCPECGAEMEKTTDYNGLRLMTEFDQSWDNIRWWWSCRGCNEEKVR